MGRPAPFRQIDRLDHASQWATRTVNGVQEWGKCRLVVESDDHKTTRLLVTDPGKIAVIGGGTLTLGCGAQKPRRVNIEYFPKADARLATAGEVASIEFP